jgi:hypothetical protein
MEATIPAIDWKAVRRRLRLIRAALDLSPAEVEAVLVALDGGDETQLIAFAGKYGQSLDWIIRGDLAPMLRILARSKSPYRTKAPSLAVTTLATGARESS